MSLWKLEKIELLNIPRKLPSGNQRAADEQLSVFEEAALDLDETIKVGLNNVAENKHVDVRSILKDFCMKIPAYIHL